MDGYNQHREARLSGLVDSRGKQLFKLCALDHLKNSGFKDGVRGCGLFGDLCHGGAFLSKSVWVDFGYSKHKVNACICSCFTWLVTGAKALLVWGFRWFSVPLNLLPWGRG